MDPGTHTPHRRLGDRWVPALGMGAMTLTQVEGYDPDRGIRTVHAALDAGVRLFDTADAYGPLGGMRAAKQLGAELAGFACVADEHRVSPQQVALAWALHRSPNLIPIPGASRPESVRDSVAALTLELSEADLLHLDSADTEDPGRAS